MNQSPAVVNFAPEKGAVEIRDFSLPQIGEDDVLLEVGAVGVCGSDLHQWHNSQSWPVNYPVVLGHEFAGTIREIGSRVVGWQENQRVVSETAAVIDANNPLSRAGLYNLDPTRAGFGYGVDRARRDRARRDRARLDIARLRLHGFSYNGVRDDFDVPTERHVALFKAYNEVLPLMRGARTILENERGVIYKSDGGEVLWAFDDFDFGRGARNVLTGETSDGQLKKHGVYVLEN